MIASRTLKLAASRATVPAGVSAFHSSSRRMQLYDNIVDTVGRTPVVKINKIGPAGRTIYAKCEFFNPLSSVKDRLAVAIINAAEASGELKPGMTVIEATSGNTGCSLAMVCAARGYKFVATMADSFSIERRRIMRRLGAKVVLTPAALKGTGMVMKAQELAKEHGYVMARQFENAANPAFHAQTTASEILSDFAGKPLDYWVTGYGTGGTFAGTGSQLKNARPDVKVVLSEPANAQLVASGVEQKRQADGSSAETHPAFNPHPIQGWTPDFVPQVTANALALGVHDMMQPVDPMESVEMSKRLAMEEGIFTGISGGACMLAAVKVAEQAPEGSVVLAMMADTAERYMSTPLFADVEVDMNEEELALSKSTPGMQLE